MSESPARAWARAHLRGTWVPLVTPFDGEQVDTAALAALVRHCAAAGVDGFVACGSTGEAAALDDDETAQVRDTVLDAAGGRPVLLGVGGNHLPTLQARLRRHAGSGIAGVLVAPPPYVRPDQAGLLAWFRCLADTTELPLVLYDIPYRTGVRLEPATCLALAAHPRIVGLKDCGGDPVGTQSLVADGRLAVLGGEDALALAALCAGAAGVIAAAAQAWPAAFVALQAAVADGRLAEARARAARLAPGIAALFAEPNPAPLKALLAARGWMRAALRPPLQPCSPPLAARLAAIDASLREASPAPAGAA
ncbi:4-hydroxy-tetrahydrodipicolinate synthase [Piscinibacter sakaiensis]|uniref:4-hydroxy-tetrahydrodipicolinate synthase n=1 Tax=Piscinibacter sakaiensis TaxID=1547922 RepID=A0A0K8NWK4_PISS1|nr:4-hydroxy-tetrahydrodipicolinate synthase [Piscinibacter sakaiensis]GAP34758.1 dihydrodipicolinate synthase [Piscinibacter sakaiensis]